jgi:arsenite-transporting ATPase
MNQSLLGSGTCDPLLLRREEAEHRYLTEVMQVHAKRVAWLPWQAEEPVGVTALSELSQSTLS